MRAVSEQDVCIRTFSARASRADVSSDQRKLTGYPIVFNSLSEDLGGWKEMIMPAAVDRTLKAGTNVDTLIDHVRSTSTVIGSSDSGLMTMRKDRYGLSIDVAPPDTTVARDVVTNVKAGLVKGMSFAFRVWRDPETDEPIGAVWDPEPDREGFYIRRVYDMTFDEVSIVLNPAYKQTEISARSAALDKAAFEEHRSKNWKPSMKLREQIARAGIR
jgi:HK97 family phage prohead protease